MERDADADALAAKLEDLLGQGLTEVSIHEPTELTCAVGVRVGHVEDVVVHLRRELQGDLALFQAEGQLGRSNKGYLDGTLNLNFKNMTSVLEILNTRGILTSDQTALLSLALQLKTDPTKESASDIDTFPLTLAFKRGRTFFGPIDIGPAPKL